MTEEMFANYLKYVEKDSCRFLKDNAILLFDNSSYFITDKVWNRTKPDFMGAPKEYLGHECIVITNNDIVVGGVLFYDRYDIQEYIFPEYRRKGYMSNIHKNGILNYCLHENQECSIESSVLESQDDLDMKLHLASYLNIKINNLNKLHQFFDTSKVSKNNIM